LNANGGYSGDESLLAYPQVMKFKVKKGTSDAHYCFCALKNRFEKLALLTGQEQTSYQAEQPVFKECKKCKDKKRTIAIVEKTVKGKPMLVLWELLTAKELNPDMPNLNPSDPILSANKRITIDDTVYYVAAERFQDPVSYMVEFDSTERWRFINLTADTHPMHLHLVQFIAKSRVKIATINNQDVANGEEIKTAVSDALGNVTIVRGVELPLDDNEKGFKDTIRVNPTEIVEIDAKFDGYMGRYVYHCHLLEHEDHDMMRQFIVTRDDVKHEGSPVSVGA